MSDEEFMEWWNECRWDKTGTELDAWPREKLKEMEALRQKLNADDLRRILASPSEAKAGRIG